MIRADLGDQLEAVIAKLVDSGRYASESDVLRCGVRLIQERKMRVATVDASLARGLADAEAGRTPFAEAVFDRLEAKYSATMHRNS